jgi:hypothetical protein
VKICHRWMTPDTRRISPVPSLPASPGMRAAGRAGRAARSRTPPAAPNLHIKPLELALTIRTFAVADGRVHLWVGGGIVWDSDPHDEIEESWVKARPLLAAIGAPRMAEVNA